MLSKVRFTGALLLSFILGCVASQLAPIVVPPVRAGENPARWEYVCVDDRSRFGELGVQGWELAAATLDDGTLGASAVWCFKRPRP